jgi:hypothetical protein
MEKFGDVVCNQISVLAFAIDWKNLEGTGSGTLKTKFYKDAYAAADTELTFAKWQKIEQRRITARNWIVRLYLAVGDLIQLYPGSYSL